MLNTYTAERAEPARDLAELDRLLAIDMASLSAPLARARAACDARAVEAREARSEYAALASRVKAGVALEYQPADVRSAYAKIESADVRHRAAGDTVRAAREERDEAFNRAVLAQLAQGAETLASTADAFNAVARALEKVHATALQHNISMSPVLELVPALRTGANALNAIANRAAG